METWALRQVRKIKPNVQSDCCIIKLSCLSYPDPRERLFLLLCTVWHKQHEPCLTQREWIEILGPPKIITHMLLYPSHLLWRKEHSDLCRKKKGSQVPPRAQSMKCFLGLSITSIMMHEELNYVLSIIGMLNYLCYINNIHSHITAIYHTLQVGTLRYI